MSEKIFARDTTLYLHTGRWSCVKANTHMRKFALYITAFTYSWIVLYAVSVNETRIIAELTVIMVCIAWNKDLSKTSVSVILKCTLVEMKSGLKCQFFILLWFTLLWMKSESVLSFRDTESWKCDTVFCC